MSVLTPQPILRHLLDRLRVNYVDSALYTDDDVLTMLNDAYLDACESTMILRTFTTVTLLANQKEYDLPTDFSQLICAIASGSQLDPISFQEALLDFGSAPAVSSGYYTYSGKIGVIPTPSAATTGTLMLLYAARPTPFSSYDDGLDARFPIEFADLLLHWVRWRVQIISGGAERVAAASTDRSLYDNRLREMRRTAETVTRIEPAQFGHVQTRRRSLNAR